MSSNKRYYSLDILKFIAAVLIALHHFQQLIPVDTGKFHFYGGPINFALCVELFFIISGFLAAMKAEEIGEQSFPDYLKKRISRLYPMPAFSVLCILILDWILFLTRGEWLGDNLPDIFKVLNSLLLSFGSGIVKSGRGLNNPMWFLNVLMWCYIILWVVMHLSKKYQWDHIYLSAIVCVTGVACYTYGTDLPLLNNSTCRGYCAFFLGILLHRLYERANRKRLFCLSAGVLLICTALVFVDYYSFYKYEYGSLTFVVFPAVIFVALGLDRFKGNAVLSNLGGISFEIYIWHILVVYAYQLIYSAEYMQSLSIVDSYMLLLRYAAIVILVATVIRFLIEKKAVGLMTGMVSWLFRKETEE